MRKDRILALADLIENQKTASRQDDDGFSMCDYMHGCGTPSCIAGWAVWESRGRPETMSVDSMEDFEQEAADFLGLDRNYRGPLFLGHVLPGKVKDITPTQAASTLRNLAATGEVVWEI